MSAAELADAFRFALVCGRFGEAPLIYLRRILAEWDAQEKDSQETGSTAHDASIIGES